VRVHHSSSGPLRLASAVRLAPALLVIGLLGGCASLDARPDLQRSAGAVARAVGVPAELLLHEAATAAETTEALLGNGLASDEAVQVALLNNPNVRVAMLSIGVSRADFVQSTLFSNPTLFLSLGLPDGGGNPHVEVSLAQSIAELWLVPARKEAAQRDLDRTVLEAARSTALVVLDVRQAYVRAAHARARVALAEDGVEIATKLVEVAELRQQAGSGSEVALNLARATKLQAAADLRNAQLAAVEARSQLCELLGLTGDPAELVLVDTLEPPAEWEVAAARLQAIARAERLDLRSMEASVASAEALARLERVRFLRSADLGFAFEMAERRSRGDRKWLAETFYDSLQSGALTPPNLMPREAQGIDTIAGPTLSLELPLWDQNQAQIARADRLLEQARQRRDALLVTVAQDIHASLARARTATENATFYRSEFVPTAARNVSLAQEGYRIGRVAFLSLLEAQRAYLATRASELDALQAAALAEIELERATGRPADVLRNGSSTGNEVPEEPALRPMAGEDTP
jgi:cobalt-zinc-cadmium efflux system outer membrane protein